MEDLLFQTNEVPLDTVLRSNAEDGILFYSVTQCARIMGLTPCQVRYAIENYRLDAIFLAGEYRIPWTAIKRFSEVDWARFSIDYFNAHRAADIEGVYDLNFNGNIGHVVRSLQALDIPLEAIPALLHDDKAQEYDDLPGEEECKEDWYYLDELELPLVDTVEGYADILRIKPSWLCWKLGQYGGRAYSASEEVGYPEILDILVDNELINFPIPVELDYSQVPPEEGDDPDQLYLF